MNDYHVTLNLGVGGTIFNIEKEKKILEGFQNSKDYIYAIVDRESNKLIGSAGLHNVNLINGTSEIGINIGDKNFWNRGYGQETMNLLMDFGFNILNLYSIYLSVLSFNQRAVKLYKKVGFTECGCMKGFRKIANERYDIIYMQIFAENFESPYIKKVMNELQTDKSSLTLKLEL